MKIKKLSFGSHYYYAALRPYRRSLFVSALGKPITLGSAGSRLLEHQKL